MPGPPTIKGYKQYFQELGGGARHGAESGIVYQSAKPEHSKVPWHGAPPYSYLLYQRSYIHTPHVSSLRILISQSQGAVPCSAFVSCRQHEVPSPQGARPGAAPPKMQRSIQLRSARHDGGQSVQDGHDALDPAWSGKASRRAQGGPSKDLLGGSE